MRDTPALRFAPETRTEIERSETFRRVDQVFEMSRLLSMQCAIGLFTYRQALSLQPLDFEARNYRMAGTACWTA